MTFWKNQPICTSQKDDIEIIKQDVSTKISNLPSDFRFKTLSLAYLDEIHNLLNNHYVQDEHVRLIYSKDFLYWFLKHTPSEYIVGLVLKNKLVGMITVSFIDMIVYSKEIRVPYINFLCIQTKLRQLNLAPALIDELKLRISKTGLSYSLFTTSKYITQPFSTTTDFIVPLNCPKLRKIEFITENINIPNPEINALNMMQKSDIESIRPRLNNFLKKFKIRPYFTNDSIGHFLLPKKNIVYSFVKRDNSQVTDFVSVYKHYLYCIEKQEMISVAQLAFYYYETMTLTELVTHLLDKLKVYGFDQFVFRNIGENEEINLTRFNGSKLYYYFFNVNIPETIPSSLFVFPF